MKPSNSQGAGAGMFFEAKDVWQKGCRKCNTDVGKICMSHIYIYMYTYIIYNYHQAIYLEKNYSIFGC